jgi:hypothetical protein
MAKGWQIIATIKRLGGGPPMKEYFVIAIADPTEAMKALRERKIFLDTDLTVDGEATSETLERLDIKDGEILSVIAFS